MPEPDLTSSLVDIPMPGNRYPDVHVKCVRSPHLRCLSSTLALSQRPESSNAYLLCAPCSHVGIEGAGIKAGEVLEVGRREDGNAKDSLHKQVIIEAIVREEDSDTALLDGLAFFRIQSQKQHPIFF
jgi:hypothetical protein